ncbi:hypothetical protein PLICRDRAFT_120117, partial [Plicaturopsis crispa FD-325 SS-3]
LSRSSTMGGGAPSRKKIALSLFPCISPDDYSWPSLSKVQQRMVLRREELSFRWQNRRNLGAVFSSGCEEKVFVRDGTEAQPCSSCRDLRKLHTFQVVLNRQIPDEANFKFVPKSFRCPELGRIYLKHEGVRKLIEEDDGRTPWLRFAKGAADGVYKSQGVVLGMVEAMVTKTERLLKGKSLKNMHYSGALDTFCSMLASISTRAYKTFHNSFGGRGLRSIR